MISKKEIVLCACNSLEHNIVIVFDEEDVYFEYHLCNEVNFFKRLILGIKYIFGYKSKYGNWGELILTKEHIPIFEEILEVLKDENRKDTCYL